MFSAQCVWLPGVLKHLEKKLFVYRGGGSYELKQLCYSICETENKFEYDGVILSN